MKPRLNYVPKSMSFSEGFLGPKGDVGYTMVADLEKAKKLVDTLDASIEDAVIGLDGDFECNSQSIFDENGNVVTDLWIHNSSCWAQPILVITYKDRPSETYECFKKQDR